MSNIQILSFIASMINNPQRFTYGDITNKINKQMIKHKVDSLNSIDNLALLIGKEKTTIEKMITDLKEQGVVISLLNLLKLIRECKIIHKPDVKECSVDEGRELLIKYYTIKLKYCFEAGQ